MFAQSPTSWTIEAYVLWEQAQPEKHELLAGQPVLRRLRLKAGGSAVHAVICSNVVGALGNRLRGGPCRAVGSDLKVLSPTGSARYPDAQIDCGPLQPGAVYFSAEPRVIVEVNSPSNHPLGLFQLLEDYQAIDSVAHVLFLAQDRPEGALWTRAESGWSRQVLSGLDASAVFSAVHVTLPFSEVYQGVPFPDPPFPQPPLSAEPT